MFQRRHLGTIIFCGLLIAASCRREPEPAHYELTGQVLAVKPETKEILVKHEDIAGFMPAMTMPYVVKDAALLKGRAPGDLISATLLVAPGSAWLAAMPPERTDPPVAQGVIGVRRSNTNVVALSGRSSNPSASTARP